MRRHGRSRRLLLINPAKKSFYRIAPSLGLAYVAAATPPDWEIEILDENLGAGDHARRGPDLVGITAITTQANRAYRIATHYRRRGVPVVMGGMHASAVPEEALRFADAVVVGEAEEIWPRVVRDFESGRMGQTYRAGAPPDLGRVVRPRRDLLGRGYWVDVLQTARGCPYDCAFCSVSAFSGRACRFRPVDDVLDELGTLRKKNLIIVDDNIVGAGRAHEERAAALFEGMIRRNIRKRWVSQAPVGVAGSDEVLRLMKASGCAGLLIGFESIRPETLVRMGKRQNLASVDPARYYREVIAKLHRFGIAVHGHICTDPADDRETMLRTIAFIRSSGLDMVNYPVLTPFPGTRLFAEKRDAFIYKDFPRDWDAFDRGRLIYPSDPLSEREFNELRLRMARASNSLGKALARGWGCIRHSGSFANGLILLSLNLYQIRLVHGDKRIYRSELLRLEGRPPV